MLRHLHLITLLEIDNQMGSEQLGRVFGTNLFGFDNWGCLNQLESTNVKNAILRGLISNAKNICEINDEQNRHILAITELLTEQNFIEIRYSPRVGDVDTVFKYHPHTNVRNIRRKLESSTSADVATNAPKPKSRNGSAASGYGTASLGDSLVLLIKMRERDSSVISRLVIESEFASLGDQILKSEEYIEAIAVTSTAEPDRNIELQHGPSWLSVQVDLRCGVEVLL